MAAGASRRQHRGTAATFVAGGGEMGALIRARDWSAHPLGPPAGWPQPLKTAIRLMLNTRHPVYVFWGAPGWCFYNDAYRATLGAERHPSSLGEAAFAVWEEIWPIIGPQIDQVMAGGEASWQENQAIPTTRDGQLTDIYWTYSYSPIDDEDAATGVGGVCVICNETTGQVEATRHMSLALAQREVLLTLDERLRDLTDAADLSLAASRMLGQALGAVRVGNGLFDHGAGTISVHAAWMAPGFEDVPGIHSLADYGDYLDELRRGMTVANTDVERDPRTAGHAGRFRAIGTRACLDVPLIEHSETVGLLFVHADRPRVWTDAEIALVRDVAERTRAAIARRSAEQQRGASEQRYRTLFETIDDGFCVLEFVDGPEGPLSDYIHVEANAAYERHAGLSDVVGRRVRAMVPDEAAGWVSMFRHVLETGKPARFEQELVATGRHLELAAFRVEPPERRQVVVLFKDVTARRRAEIDLIETAERLRLATDHAEVGSWDVDPVDDVLIWPARTKAMFGISPDVPVTMRDFYEGLHPDDRAATGAAYEAAADPARRALYDAEYRTIGKEDGVVRWVAAKGRGLFDEDGRCFRVLGTAIDITARKRDEERLRDLNETLEQRIEEGSAALRLYQNIVQSDAAPVVAFDHDYRITAFNAAHAAYFRRTYRKETRIGDVLPDTLLPEHGRQTRKLMARALAGETFAVRASVGDPAIETVPADISYNPLRDGEGRIIGAFQHAVDVSGQLAAEAELASAQEALRQSQKMEAMGQLTGGVAHDFNNLLTPIVGALDLLARKSLGGEREQRLIAGAAQSAERARTLVQRLLAFARRQPLQPVAVDLAALVHGMAELIRSTTGPQIRVKVDAPADLPPAAADPNQLEMALLNLAVNARDAMPEGGTLRITATQEAVTDDPGLRPGGYLRLSVADTGTGMDEATLARAIEPFFSTKGIGKGTGLGLSMAHGLASQLGGALRIGSKPGLGTNVELWLPRSRDRPAVAAPAQEAAAVERRGTALLVDDEQLVRDTTADMLAELGYRVVEAASGEEALMILANGSHVDLVVTDHLMPGMTGTDLARAAREHRRDLPVLVVSGYADVDGIAPDLPRLTKPFRKDELAASLAAL